MELQLSRRSARITQAEIRAMTLECEKMGGINLAQGVCDTEVPAPVRMGAQRAIEEGMNSYTRCDGVAPLRKAISQKMERHNKIVADPETQIVVSAGSTGALYCGLLALLDPGDEVILFEPYYGYHVNTILAVDAVPQFVTLNPPNWNFDVRELERTISSRTKAIIINTPANPTGKVFSRAELEVLADFAERQNLFVFTDEIYEYFLYGGSRHLSPGALDGMADRTITISGLSKTFGITGWRIGYSVSRADWALAISQVNDLVYVCAPAPLQYGVAAGLAELDDSFYRELAVQYEGKRSRICSALSQAGLAPHLPQGAYYILADISRLPGKGSKAKAMHLLSQTGVACVPGEAFYHNGDGDNLARFCFAKSECELEEACRRLRTLGSAKSNGTPSVSR
jgi:aminotransferase